MPLKKGEIKKLLEKEKIVYIATTKEDGAPHVVPIWFIVHNGKIYFETDITTVKYQNMKRNKKIALCFGGRKTYIVEGTFKEYKESELDFPIRKLYWQKYKKDMDDEFINEDTRLFEVISERELSWHYAPEWD